MLVADQWTVSTYVCLSKEGRPMERICVFHSPFLLASPIILQLTTLHPPPPHPLHVGGVSKVSPVIPPTSLWLQRWHRRKRVKGWEGVWNQTRTRSTFSLISSLTPSCWRSVSFFREATRPIHAFLLYCSSSDHLFPDTISLPTNKRNFVNFSKKFLLFAWFTSSFGIILSFLNKKEQSGPSLDGFKTLEVEGRTLWCLPQKGADSVILTWQVTLKLTIKNCCLPFLYFPVPCPICSHPTPRALIASCQSISFIYSLFWVSIIYH